MFDLQLCYIAKTSCKLIIKGHGTLHELHLKHPCQSFDTTGILLRVRLELFRSECGVNRKCS